MHSPAEMSSPTFALNPAEQVAYGSILKRLGAATIDTIVVYVFSIFFNAFFPVLLFGTDAGSTGNAILLALEFLLYGTVMEAMSGQTLGKMVFGLKVVDERTGGPVAGWQAMVRNLFKVFGFVWWIFPSVIIAAVSKRRQRVGDLLASTIVISHKERIQV